MTASDTRTGCAYKGFASYWSVGDEDDVVWSYPEPQREAERIRDYLAFFNERVDIEVDGELAGAAGDAVVRGPERRRLKPIRRAELSGRHPVLAREGGAFIGAEHRAHHLDDARVELRRRRSGAALRARPLGVTADP